MVKAQSEVFLGAVVQPPSPRLKPSNPTFTTAPHTLQLRPLNVLVHDEVETGDDEMSRRQNVKQKKSFNRLKMEFSKAKVCDVSGYLCLSHTRSQTYCNSYGTPTHCNSYGNPPSLTGSGEWRI